MSTQQTFPHSSLFVSDLHPDVNESILFELFKEAGTIVSIHVCRDAVTRVSLGYAYVNFQNAQEAEKAIETLNFTSIHDRPIKVTWSQRDPSIRKSGVGNVFVKNFGPEIDEKSLHDIFSTFGKILSVKISYKNEKNERVSNGYGFVQFADEESAKKAIDTMNGKYMNDKQITVTNFISKTDRPNSSKEFTNLYVKHLPKDVDDEKLKALFAEFGSVQNAKVEVDEEGKSRGFGFVNYHDHESAQKAIDGLNGKPTGEEEGKNYYVSRAQAKDERKKLLLTQRNMQNQVAKEQNNLYVRNFPDDVDEEKLKELFQPFGEIRSVRVMRDKNKKTSRGFGFVSFEKAEDAAKAINEMHKSMYFGKPLFVAAHEPKSMRKAHIDKIRREAQGMNNPLLATPMMYGQFPFPMGPSMPYAHQGMMPAWDPNHMGPALHMMSDEDRKQHIGNQLYNLVHGINPDNAAKITGMFLELKEDEIQELLVDNGKLRERVNDALGVLHNAQQTSS